MTMTTNQSTSESVILEALGGKRSLAALICLATAVLTPSLAVSIANVALPTLQSTFGASFAQMQWILLAYLLAVTATVVSAGRLGDLLDRRRLMLVGAALFAVSSVLCALSPAISYLIAARFIQGLGAAVMMALSMAIATDLFPDGQRGRAMGLLGTMSAIGTALGPTIGGLLIGTMSWRAIFVLNALLGALVYYLTRQFLVQEEPKFKDGAARFDITGTLLLTATLAVCSLAATVGHGKFGMLNVGFLLSAALLGMLLFRVEARQASPLLPAIILSNRVLRSALLANALVSTVMMATLVVGPFYLARVLGLSPVFIGLCLSGGPAIAAFAGVPAGRMADRLGSETTGRAGLVVMAIAALVLILVPDNYGVRGYVTPISLLTLGYAMFQAANNTLVMRESDSRNRGLVSGLLSLSRNLGLISGAALMGAVFAHVAGSLDLSVKPADAAAGMHATFAVALALSLVALALSWGKRRVGISGAGHHELPV